MLIHLLPSSCVMGRTRSGHVSPDGHQAVPIDCRTAPCDVFTLCLDLLTWDMGLSPPQCWQHPTNCCTLVRSVPQSSPGLQWGFYCRKTSCGLGAGSFFLESFPFMSVHSGELMQSQVCIAADRMGRVHDASRTPILAGEKKGLWPLAKQPGARRLPYVSYQPVRWTEGSLKEM